MRTAIAKANAAFEDVPSFVNLRQTASKVAYIVASRTRAGIRGGNANNALKLVIKPSEQTFPIERFGMDMMGFIVQRLLTPDSRLVPLSMTARLNKEY